MEMSLVESMHVQKATFVQPFRCLMCGKLKEGTKPFKDTDDGPVCSSVCSDRYYAAME